MAPALWENALARQFSGQLFFGLKLKTLRATPPQHPFDVDLWALSQVSKRLSTKYLEALKPIFKKIFVCEVRFRDAVLVDVVPMGGSQIF